MFSSFQDVREAKLRKIVIASKPVKGPKVSRQSTCSVFRTSWSEIAWTLNGQQTSFLAAFSIISFLLFLRIEFCAIAAKIKRSRILISLYFGNTLNWICSSYQTKIIPGPARLLRVRKWAEVLWRYILTICICLLKAKSSYFHFSTFSTAEFVHTRLHLTASSLLWRAMSEDVMNMH